MTLNLNSLNNSLLDVLKEVGNIGAGNAITALAKMINKKVDMEVPKVKMIALNEVNEILGGEQKVIGILLRVNGDITGNIMFILEYDVARALVGILLDIVQVYGGNGVDFNELELSALKEVGNILTGAYLSALSTLTNLKILPSTPDLAIDMAGAIFSVAAIEFSKVSDVVLYIENEFSEGVTKVKGDFFLMPDFESYEILLKSLGVIEK